MKKLFNNILFWGSIYLLFHLIIIVNAKKAVVSVSNEKEFLDGILLVNDTSVDEIILNIKEATVTINDPLYIDITTHNITIVGDSKEFSILRFKNVTEGLHISNVLDDSSGQVTLVNCTYYGHLDIYGTRYAMFNNSIFYGSLYTDRISEESTGFFDPFAYREDCRKTFVGFYNFNFTAMLDPASSQRHDAVQIVGHSEIIDSSFKGSFFCEDSVINFEASGCYKLYVKNSIFDGMNANTCLTTKGTPSAQVYSSTFINGGGYCEGGGGYKAYGSISLIEDCKFINHHTGRFGGAFYLLNPTTFEANRIEVRNATADDAGGIIHVKQMKPVFCEVSFSDVQYYGTDDTNNRFVMGGTIAGLEGVIHLTMNNIYAENLYEGEGNGLFYADSDQINLELSNIKIDKVYGKKNGGLFYHSLSDASSGYITINNGTFSNFYHHGKQQSSLFIWTKKNMEISLRDCQFTNLDGLNSYFIYNENPGSVSLDNVHIDNFKTNTPTSFFRSEHFTELNHTSILLNNFYLNDYSAFKDFINCDLGNIDIYNSEIKNVKSCFFDFNCHSEEIITADLIVLGDDSIIKIQNTTVDGVQGDHGFKIKPESKVYIIDSKFYNNNFFDGLISIDTLENEYSGDFSITNSQFINNTSINGPIVNIKKGASNYKVEFYNSKFEGNMAAHDGGVFYSESDKANLYNSFNDCEFFRNMAINVGSICYSFSKESEPKFTNIDELRKIEGGFRTNPTKLVLAKDSENQITINSGDTIKNNVKFNLLDDYDKMSKIELYDTISSVMFFKVEIDDSYNAAIIGETMKYCLNDECALPPIKVIGNPGNYKIKLSINLYGNYQQFPNNTGEVDLTIKNCDISESSEYLNNDIENIGFKSCYKPQCSPSCNSGKCVNNNLCDCSSTPFIGRYCNEYKKLTKSKTLIFTARILAVFIAITTILLMGKVYTLKNNPQLKAASINFMVVILFGLLFNSLYIYVTSIDIKTKDNCLMSYISNNMGFSLIFGSILVKNYRVYKIFNDIKKHSASAILKNMYLGVILIALFHIVLTLIWIGGNNVGSTLDHINNLEYSKCTYPASRNLSKIFNLLILCLGWIISYFNRFIKKEFNENMTIPTYTYLLTMVFIEVIHDNNMFTYIIQDLFDMLGTVLNTFVVVYCLFLQKFYDISVSEALERAKSNSTLKKSNTHVYNSNNMIYGSAGFLKNGSQEFKNSGENIRMASNDSLKGSREFKGSRDLAPVVPK